MRLTRLERVKLLLRTYPDVCTAGRGEHVGRSKPSSRQPNRHELWDEGSYWDLERGLDVLRWRSGKVYWHTRQRFILQSTAPEVRTRKAELGAVFLREWMPNIFVPLEISLNAGYSPAEAKSAAKPTSYRDAA